MNDVEAQLHDAVGTGAGVVEHEGKPVPVVTMHFARGYDVIDDLESGKLEFDPADETSWKSYALSIRAARQLVSDLNDAIEAAIQGPPK